MTNSIIIKLIYCNLIHKIELGTRYQPRYRYSKYSSKDTRYQISKNKIENNIFNYIENKKKISSDFFKNTCYKMYLRYTFNHNIKSLKKSIKRQLKNNFIKDLHNKGYIIQGIDF